MSSLPSQLPPAAGSQQPAWLDLHECARRMGLASNHVVRRFHVQKWAAAGMARIDTSVKPPQWMVSELADPRLQPAAGSQRKPGDTFDLAQLTDAQRSTLLMREACVLDWQRLRAQSGRGKVKDLTERFAAERGVGRQSLYNWEAAYMTLGRAGLLDKRSRVAGEVRPGEDPFGDFYRELTSWHHDGHQTTARTAYKLATRVARGNGWNIPCERSARRFLAQMNRGKAARGRLGEGDKAEREFVNSCGAHIIRDYTRIAIDGVEREMFSNDIWCADHHICDTLVQHEGKLVRPWFTAIEDLRSRAIVGFRFAAGAPDSTAVLLAVRDGVFKREMGLPTLFYADNGKDFAGWMLNGSTKWERRKTRVVHDGELFKGVFGHLQVRVIHARPFNAKAKPVERFFGTFEQQFGKLTHTYCGRNPQEKPLHLEDRLKRGESPTFAEYARDATAWIEQIYHNTPHTGHGMNGRTPNQVYAEQLGQVRTTTREALDICLQKTSKPAKVMKNGVAWGHHVYGRGEPALRPWFGKHVQLRTDPEDITRVSVWTVDGRFVCNAIEAELSPWGALPDEKSKAIHATIRRHNKALAEVEKYGMRRKISPLDVLLDERLTDREAGKPVPPPPSNPPVLKIVHTGFEGVSNDSLADAHQPPPAEVQPPKISVLDKLLRASASRVREDQAERAMRPDPWAKATQLREVADAG